jgi:hypothetical protein
MHPYPHVSDLESEDVALLPEREALSFIDYGNVANVAASNTAVALNAGSCGWSMAHAVANQNIDVTQL